MRTAVTRLPLVLLALGLASCVSRSDLEQIKKNQKDIMAKLDQISRGRPTPPTRRGPRPGTPDPSKVYAFPIADSPVQGPKDAWVTIVEISDFQ